MPIRDQIDALLQEKMDRKDFLKYAGTIVLGVVGVTGIVRMLLGSRGLLDAAPSAPPAKTSKGYGSSSYGK